MRPHGPPGTPILGNLKDFRTDLLAWLLDCARTYGDFVPARLAVRRGYLVSGPDLVADVLVRKHQDFRKVFLLRNNRLFLGGGLLTSEGERWKRNRRLTQPSFHHDRIADYTNVIVDESAKLADGWRSGDVIDAQDEMAVLTLPIITRTLFGGSEVRIDDVATGLDVIQQRMKERYQALVPLPDTAWTPRNVRLRRAVKRLDGVIAELIARRQGLLGELSKAGMTDAELRDEVMTMLFAGHETTALTLSWVWYLLSEHPHEEWKLHDELDAVLGGHPPTAEDVPKLEGVTRLVKEVMRLYPPVYAFGRDARTDTEVGEHRIKRGQTVIIAPWVLHRDPRFFPEPDEFRPDRWTPEFERGLPKFAYCPFGGGARMCMGKGFAMTEAVLAIATIAQRFRLRHKGDPVELWPTFTLRSRHGMPMVLEER